MRSPKYSVIFLHLVSWLLFFSLIISFDALSSSQEALWSEILSPHYLLFYAVYLSIFYFNLQVLVPRLYLKRQYSLYLFVIAALLIAVCLIQPFDQIFSHNGNRPGPPPGAGNFPGDHFPPPGPANQAIPGPRRHIDIVSIILFVMIWSVSTAIQILRQWRLTEQRAVQAEAGKARSELSFLKAQINPHFLFNTLNNIYSLSLSGSDRTPAAILKLSNIMRYMTDEVSQDFVPLENEIGCIRDYIDLQRIRLNDKVLVNFSVMGDPVGREIAPLVLMTFIENVFKYGISIHEPADIIIKVFIDQNSVDFFCQNRIFVARQQPDRTGIGISNTRQRLEHLYPSRHTLSIVSDKELFTVHLRLQLTS